MKRREGLIYLLELVGRFAIVLALRLHDGNLLDLFELGLVHTRCCRIGLVERIVDFARVLEHTFEFGPFIRLFAVTWRHAYRSRLQVKFKRMMKLNNKIKREKSLLGSWRTRKVWKWNIGFESWAHRWAESCRTLGARNDIGTNVS